MTKKFVLISTIHYISCLEKVSHIQKNPVPLDAGHVESHGGVMYCTETKQVWLSAQERIHWILIRHEKVYKRPFIAQTQAPRGE